MVETTRGGSGDAAEVSAHTIGGGGRRFICLQGGYMGGVSLPGVFYLPGVSLPLPPVPTAPLYYSPCPLRT